LFLAEFIPVIAVAGLAACPLAYVVMQRWLAHYASRIAVTPLPFIGSVVGRTDPAADRAANDPGRPGQPGRVAAERINNYE
jgi:hypothetical protein